MASSIIPDSNSLQPNISFEFDQSQKDKLIINALADHTSYQIQFNLTPDLDFDDLKASLISKHFKLTLRTPSILKLKMGINYFEFKNLSQITIHSLTSTIADLTHQLKHEALKSKSLELKNNNLQKYFDQIKEKYEKQQGELIDLKLKIDKSKNEKKLLSEQSQQLTYKKIKTDRQEPEQQVNNEGTYEQKSLTHQTKQPNEKSEPIQIQISANKTKFEVNSANKNPVLINSASIQSKPYANQYKEKEMQTKVELPLFSRTSKNIKFKFSQVNRNNKVKLTTNNLNATTPEKIIRGRDPLALVEGILQKKDSSIRFKIQSTGKGLYVGLCLKNVVAINSFRLKNYEETGHGCFMLGCFGWSYSHSHKEHNGAGTRFKYDEGDEIEVRTSGDELLFSNQSKKRQFKMGIKLTEKEWQQARFCVDLLGDGSSVKILNE